MAGFLYIKFKTLSCTVKSKFNVFEIIIRWWSFFKISTSNYYILYMKHTSNNSTKCNSQNWPCILPLSTYHNACTRWSFNATIYWVYSRVLIKECVTYYLWNKYDELAFLWNDHMYLLLTESFLNFFTVCMIYL